MTLRGPAGAWSSSWTASSSTSVTAPLERWTRGLQAAERAATSGTPSELGARCRQHRQGHERPWVLGCASEARPSLNPEHPPQHTLPALPKSCLPPLLVLLPCVDPFCVDHGCYSVRPGVLEAERDSISGLLSMHAYTGCKGCKAPHTRGNWSTSEWRSSPNRSVEATPQNSECPDNRCLKWSVLL
jgi:hypothetical protein